MLLSTIKNTNITPTKPTTGRRIRCVARPKPPMAWDAPYHVVFDVAAECCAEGLHHLARDKGGLLSERHHRGEVAEQRADLTHRLLQRRV